MATTQKGNTNSSSNNNNNKLYVYDLGRVGNRTPEYYPTSMATSTKKVISRSYWGLKRSSNSTKNSKKETGHRSAAVAVVAESEKKEAGGGKLHHHHQQQQQQQQPHPVTQETKRRSVSEVESYLISSKEDSAPRNMSINYYLSSPPPPSLLLAEINNNNDNRKKKEINYDDVVVEGRKSVSHVENNVAFVGRKLGGSLQLEKSCSFKLQLEAKLLQVKVLVTDMPGFMQLHAFRCARTTYDSLESFSAKHLAFNLKKEFDNVYGPAWQCIVGSSFGSFVTHSTGCFLYFSLDKLYILLFRTKVRKAVD